MGPSDLQRKWIKRRSKMKHPSAMSKPKFELGSDLWSNALSVIPQKRPREREREREREHNVTQCSGKLRETIHWRLNKGSKLWNKLDKNVRNLKTINILAGTCSLRTNVEVRKTYHLTPQLAVNNTSVWFNGDLLNT